MSKVRNIPVLQIEAAGVVRSAGSFRCPRMQKRQSPHCRAQDSLRARKGKQAKRRLLLLFLGRFKQVEI